MNDNGLRDAIILVASFHLSIQGFQFLMQFLKY